MDTTQKTSNALHERVQTSTLQLFKKFEAILALTPVKSISDGDAEDGSQKEEYPSRTKTAVEGYGMEVQTAALVRAAEDILSLTRDLKEAWLFGQLNSVDGEDAKGREKVGEDVAVVERVLEGLMKEENA